MRCTNPIEVRKELTVNCGKCLACRINYTQMWSLRLIYELSTCNAASFITLTYDNEHLPKDFSLDPKALQDFWKRLRINLRREYHEFAPKIRYYACGEYGDKQKIYLSPGAEKPHGRPHYHAIVFGLDDMNDKHRDILRRSWTQCEPWMFDKERGKDSGMQDVTPDDINYVTGYVQKKLSGDSAKKCYGEAVPPFSRSSQELGLEFALKNKDRLMENGWTYFKGHKVSLPRYFCDKFGVQKSEYIKNFDNKALDNIKLVTDDFISWTKNNGTFRNWDLENTALLERRFKFWLQNHNQELTKQIYDDYVQRRKLKGSKI